MPLSKKQFILNKLECLFPDPQPSLTGWETPFQFLVSVLLSGNSTDKAVNTIAPKLFQKAPSPETMSTLTQKQLYSLIKPCGLGERKASYLLALSQRLIQDHHSEPPKTLEELTSLPGVGRKTASVFLSVLYNKPTFPVDTHILRLAQRWGITKAKTPFAVEKDLVKFFGLKNSKKLHLQLILFARKYCPAKGHQQALCPICSYLSKRNLTG
ncbi:endonuclease III domain-containing protein [Chlamydiifrater phoenicopteri]|uniref:endonuclease III domain-containing protein n=1 Tax=Chlamydiifrater phoenicopteri TaxID=2681469 RepID=UPI001BCC2B36|nr:endonuclease III [Chlamydiifrater phoenicopteri]